MAKMRLEPSRWKESVAPAILYRHDLEELANLVGDAKFIVGSYLYDTIDEVAADRGTSIKKLKVVAFKEGEEKTAVDLGTGANIVADDEGRGLKIREFLKARRTAWARHADLIPILFSLPCWCLLMAFNYLFYPSADLNQVPIWQGLLLLAMVYLMVRWTGPWRRRCRISTLPEHEHLATTFWGRNKDKYVFEAAKMLASSVVGGVVGWYLGSHHGG